MEICLKMETTKSVSHRVNHLEDFLDMNTEEFMLLMLMPLYGIKMEILFMELIEEPLSMIMGGPSGYVFEGGDAKYKDQNYDGKIDELTLFILVI